MTVPLSALLSRPYAVDLASPARPEDVLGRLPATDHPGALWGQWFGGGVVLFRRPLRTVALDHADDGLDWLDDQPRVTNPFDGLGGGWLTNLGYARGHSGAAFYDSLLRWRPGDGWRFESLGLDGRRSADRAALDGWTELLTDGGAAQESGSVGVFRTREAPQAARDHYLAAVEAAIGRVHDGDFYQVNLCTRLHATGRIEPASWFGELAAAVHPAYGALVTGPDRALCSLSPELFLRVRGREVTTSPIKGTAPRRAGETDSPALRASAKDAAENVMIVDLMRNDLSRVCATGTVAVRDLLTVEPHPGVWHLVSTVRGQLVDGVGTAELLRATFPPGSVTGAPKSAAVRGIADLELESRGAYTGTIGLVSPYAGAEFNVTIRTFEVEGDGIALGVGGGLTADSVPVREWYECLHKARPLIGAAGARLDPALDVEPTPEPALAAGGIFESVLVSHGRARRLEPHLARLDTSCRELYGVGLPAELPPELRALVAAAEPEPRAALRIVVRPSESAGITVESDLRPLGPRLVRAPLVHAPRPGRVWRHKWADRTALTTAEEQATPALPYFTAPDRPDRLAETSRGNLFWLEADGAWRTPPLDESVLPGVTRRAALDLLADLGVDVRIEAGTRAQLQHARAAFWTSSLSGAVAVDRVDGHPLGGAFDLIARLNHALGHAPDPPGGEDPARPAPDDTLSA